MAVKYEFPFLGHPVCSQVFLATDWIEYISCIRALSCLYGLSGFEAKSSKQICSPL